MRFEQWPHQAEEFDGHWSDEARALLWQMRSGKSKTTIDTLFMQRDWNDLSGVIITAPNGVHSNWVRRELPRHSWDDGHHAVAWRSSERDIEERVARTIASSSFPILSINVEALQLERVQRLVRLMLRRKRVGLVSDECHDFRTPGSRRTGLARGLAKRCVFRRILSGTAVLNSPLHAYSQFELLKPGALGFDDFAAFKRRFSVQVPVDGGRPGKRYWKTAGFRNLPELRERIAPWASVVLRSDIEGMPSLLETERECPLTPAMAEAYRLMADEWLADLAEPGEMTVLEGGVRLLKLQQILGGFIMGPDGEPHSIEDDPPRLDAMVEQVDGTFPGKSIVWCRFREDIRRVVAKLRASGYTPVEYHGGISPKRKDEAEDRFREDPSANPLVGQPQSAGLGLDLSAADAIIWYSHSHNAIVREQAKERATQKGGRSIAHIDLVTHGTVEDDVLACLSERRDVSDMLAGSGLKALLTEMLRRTDV